MSLKVVCIIETAYNPGLGLLNDIEETETRIVEIPEEMFVRFGLDKQETIALDNNQIKELDKHFLFITNDIYSYHLTRNYERYIDYYEYYDYLTTEI